MRNLFQVSQNTKLNFENFMNLSLNKKNDYLFGLLKAKTLILLLD